MTGASVRRKEDPKSERRRWRTFVVSAREVGSSMSRSRPSSFLAEMRLRRGL
jgi:hypothetical protein